MTITPLRRQYLQIKKQYPDVLVLFRLGDFYETFDDDARLASSVLGITLTSREMGKGQRVPMAGIPHHSLDGYLGKLIRAGHKVAVCDQTSDPAEAKGLVDREVSRVITPGTVVEPQLLDQKANNFLAALVREGGQAALAHLDVSTSEFAVTQLADDRLPNELARLGAAELLYPRGAAPPMAGDGAAPPATALDPRAFDPADARERLLRHFGVASLEAYGCEHLPLAQRAAAAVLAYVGETQKTALGRITLLSTYSVDRYMALDPQTRRNLELTQGGRWGGPEHSLLAVLDETRTAMGGRLLRRWLSQPLLDIAALEQRLDAVAWFVAQPIARGKTAALVARIADLERLINRVQSAIATPKELVALRRSLELVPEMRAVLDTDSVRGEALEPQPNATSSADTRSPSLGDLPSQLKPCAEAASLIARAIADDPPVQLSDGGVIRAGFHEELDRYRAAGGDARGYLADLEKRERERTGIRSLKVGYNRVFGYYIEVSNASAAQAPADYVRKQTLTGGERFITPELKEYETLILNAQERVQELEATLFRQVCAQVAGYAAPVLETARALAQLDVHSALADVAARRHYTRPALADAPEMRIVNGRHPIVERHLDAGAFVPNDVDLSADAGQLVVLTGPNMAGKSTYLRQAGLIVLMAQIGSFVPADAARIGIVDRVFTRVGLQDDLATGQSTFMVEMIETAHILNNATRRSLIILDEIGRGTSTHDGLAIARAVAEHIHNAPRLGAMTLFATHYHELTDLADYLPRVRNFRVAVSEEGGTIAFLHKIIPGGADKSYGVHVAELAGMPRPVIARAQEALQVLERADGGAAGKGTPSAGKAAVPHMQLTLFTPPSAALAALSRLDVASLTPLEAITKLFELQAKARAEGEA
ncbi:MAG: DNA mismatch repair protein MutS [Dehalococcoidia bacterium]|nr:DNA mismatch repair protein MutS [Dehalococcoidia bacterium]